MNSNVEIHVRVNGSRCKIYNHEGKSYLEGKPGSEYEIYIKNHSYNRIEAVATVDGLSVLSGKPGKTEDNGYIINNNSAYSIKGFRYSDAKVGSFRFSKKNQSYAASKQDGSEINCGIICCRVYSESKPYTIKKVYIPYSAPTNYYPYYYGHTTGTPFERDECKIMCSSVSEPEIKSSNTFSCSNAFSLGTEWGSSKKDVVTATSFIRGMLIEDFTLYYTDREGLLALGVPLIEVAKVNFPQGFPGDFAEPPKEWRE